MRSALRLVACLSYFVFCSWVLTSVAGCDALWGGFRDPYPGNCVTNPGICTGGLVCNAQTRLCEAADAGSGGDGSSSSGDGGLCAVTGTSCSADGYCIQQVPSSDDLYGIGGFSTASIWAVGNSGVILSWNGQTWQKQQPVVNPLYGIWGSGLDNLWAVGNAGTILKWNGSSWSPQSAVTNQTLNAILGISPTSIWAVGVSDTVIRWNGSTWSTVPFSFIRQLSGVWYRDESNVWVVADSGFIFRYDGSSWMTEHSTGTVLRAVWGAATDNLWAVGGMNANSGTILHGDGAGWSAQQNGLSSPLNAITGCDANNVWAAGDSGTIFKLQGSTWTPQASGTSQNIRGAFAISTSCGCSVFFVGTGGLVLRK